MLTQIAKNVSKEMLGSISIMQESIKMSLSKAEKSNATIYLQRIPKFCDIPVTDGALMVKATPPTCLEPPMIGGVSMARGEEMNAF